MGVQIKVAGVMRQATEWNNFVEVEGSTPLECLENFEKKYPDTKKWIYDRHGVMQDRFQIFMNGEQIPRDEFSRTISEKDELMVLLNICGG